MNILGPDELVFGVADAAGAFTYMKDYGLTPVGGADEAGGGYLEALDGTGVRVHAKDDPRLPPASSPSNALRETVFGVADEATLDAIEAELRSDRKVERLPDGALRSHDDDAFVIKFQKTVRRPYEAPAEVVNSPGSDHARTINRLGADPAAHPKPRTLSHLVVFVPDFARSEAFYVGRLGFRVTDRFQKVGPFLQAGGSQDHHALFMIQTPPHMKGVEHFAFHMGGPTEVMQAGRRFVEKGYQSFWGPGRHWFGSNWFWYFNSPLGCKVEYDADMDLHDTSWTPRDADMSADTSQVFLFQWRELWAPGGPPRGGPPGGGPPKAPA